MTTSIWPRTTVICSEHFVKEDNVRGIWNKMLELYKMTYVSFPNRPTSWFYHSSAVSTTMFTINLYCMCCRYICYLLPFLAPPLFLQGYTPEMLMRAYTLNFMSWLYPLSSRLIHHINRRHNPGKDQHHAALKEEVVYDTKFVTLQVLLIVEIFCPPPMIALRQKLLFL